MTNKNIDVFVISFNRLTYLKSIINWLEKAGFENIHIIDNNSTYPPLLEYLKFSKHDVCIMDKNYGHLVVWACGKFNDILNNKYYIVSDCDILPVNECTSNVTEYFLSILNKYRHLTKVGFALKVDDLPDQYLFKDVVVDWEKKFWTKKIDKGLFDAPIDTTFALYRPGIFPNNKYWYKSIRTDYPYVARHLPWYSDSSKISEEDQFYLKEINESSSNWVLTDVNMLQKRNNELRTELMKVYKSRKWIVLQIIYKFFNLFLPLEKIHTKIGKKLNLFIVNSDAKLLLKNNIEISSELNSIRNSMGWRVLKKLSNIVRK